MDAAVDTRCRLVSIKLSRLKREALAQVAVFDGKRVDAEVHQDAMLRIAMPGHGFAGRKAQTAKRVATKPRSAELLI